MYGKQLLDWLDEYTFPAEEAFSSMEYAQDIARFFVKELVKNGTTTCAAYATVHPASVTALFSVATVYLGWKGDDEPERSGLSDGYHASG